MVLPIEAMCFSSPDNQLVAALSEEFPPKQLQACALWFMGIDGRPLSERQVADVMGNSQPAAHKLIRKGIARIERLTGRRPVRATARA